MVSVSIQNIIGTVSLIALVISASLFYSVFTSSIQDDIKKTQLGQISESIALTIEETINLMKFSTKYNDDSNYIIRVINLPNDLGGLSYKVRLVNDGINNRTIVNSCLSTRETLNANSTIPYNSGGDVPLKFNTTAATYTINAGIDYTPIICSGTIYGKTGTVVWANTQYDNVTRVPLFINIGIGWVVLQQ